MWYATLLHRHTFAGKLIPLGTLCEKCGKSIREIFDEIEESGKAFLQEKSLDTLNKYNPCEINDEEYKLKMLLK